MRLVDIGDVEKAIREYFKKQIDKGAPSEWSILEYNADLQDIMAHKVPTFYDEDKIMKEKSESRRAAELGKLLAYGIECGLKSGRGKYENLIDRFNEESDASCENFDKYAEEHAICKNENTLSAGLIRAVEIIRECESDGNG